MCHEYKQTVINPDGGEKHEGENADMTPPTCSVEMAALCATISHHSILHRPLTNVKDMN